MASKEMFKALEELVASQQLQATSDKGEPITVLPDTVLAFATLAPKDKCDKELLHGSLLAEISIKGMRLQQGDQVIMLHNYQLCDALELMEKLHDQWHEEISNIFTALMNDEDATAANPGILLFISSMIRSLLNGPDEEKKE